MARILEIGRSTYDQYPRGVLTCSMPIKDDPTFSRLPYTERKPYGVHVVYLGKDGRFFEDAYPYNKPHGQLITAEDYAESSRHHGVPLPPQEYTSPTTLWVASRRQRVDVRVPVDNNRREGTIIFTRQQDAPEIPHTEIKDGPKMVEALVDEYRFAPYDLTYLTGETRQQAHPTNVIGGIVAKVEDVRVRSSKDLDGTAQKVIRAVTFPNR